MNKILVLGAGMVGRAIAYDLSQQYEVTSADISEESLAKVKRFNNVKTLYLDVRDKNKLSNVLKDYDFVVSAVPGFLGFETIKTIIENKKDFVDISFLPEDALILDELAKKYEVCGIVDMGVAPGVPNLVAGYYYKHFKIDTFEYMVGGLPKTRTMPFQYKAPFSPIDVIEEYTRPARHKINGKIIAFPAMSDAEYVYFENIGTLEAFNTDGLRSLLYTLPNIPNMKEKTLRYPGHIAIIKALMEAGFMSKKPIRVGEQKIIPFDFTTTILFDNWKLGDTEPELTVMKIRLQTENKTIVVNLYDEYDSATQLSSMARTTGYAATAGLQLMINGLFKKKGIFPPEIIAQEDGCYDFVIKYIRDRGITIIVKESIL